MIEWYDRPLSKICMTFYVHKLHKIKATINKLKAIKVSILTVKKTSTKLKS